MANYTASSTTSIKYGPWQDTASVYDSSTDDYDGTGLASTAVDLTYDGIKVVEGGSTNYTASSATSTNYTST